MNDKKIMRRSLASSIGLFLAAAFCLVSSQAQAVLISNIFYVQFLSTNYVVDKATPGYVGVAIYRYDLYGMGMETSTVDYRTVDGTAMSGVDYQGISQTLTFGMGETVRFVYIPIYNNLIVGSNRFFNIVLSNPSTNAVLGSATNATVTIIDSDVSTAYPDAGQVEIAPGNSYPNFVGNYMVTREEWRNSASLAGRDDGPLGAQFTIVRKGKAKGRILVDWTTTTNIVPSYSPDYYYYDGYYWYGYGSGGVAVPYNDFLPANGTVTMDDFQMSTNLLIRLPNISYGIGGFFDPETNRFLYPVTFGILITNVRAAPEEDPNVIAPVLGVTTRNVDITDTSIGFSFVRRHFEVSEGQRSVRILVRRSQPYDQTVTVRFWVNNAASAGSEGDNAWNTFPLEPGSDYSLGHLDFIPPGSPEWHNAMGQTNTTGDTVLSWSPNEGVYKTLEIPLVNDSDVEFNEDMMVEMYQRDGDNGYINPYGRYCTVKIMHDDQTAGAGDRTFNLQDNAFTDPPHNLTPGANGPVQAVKVQPDGKVLLGGDFNSYNTYNKPFLARSMPDGQVDHTFQIGLGPNGFVHAIALQDDGRIVIGGNFTAYDGTPRSRIARLMPNGALDATFNPGYGVNGAVHSIGLQQDGKILIGGEFDIVNGTNLNYVARLNTNGAVDTTFQPGLGPNGPVYAIALGSANIKIDRNAAGGPAEDRYSYDTGSSSGTVMVKFDFLTVPDTLNIYCGNQSIYSSGMTNGIGVVTVPFGPGPDTVITVVINEGNNSNEGTLWMYSLEINTFRDDRPVIGGYFNSVNGTNRNFVARLNMDGSLDATFESGMGPNDAVYAAAKQGSKVIIGGAFSVVDQWQRRGVARLNINGSLDTTYEIGTGTDNDVYSICMQPDGKAVIGGTFTSINNVRRVSLARINQNGMLDTSFADTAYNQFCGLINPFCKENPRTQNNFIRAIDNYYQESRSVTTVTNIVDNITNVVTTTNFSSKNTLYVGGSFRRIGGGRLRDSIIERYNFAAVIGGSTPGPGNLSFVYDNYNVNEMGQRRYLVLTRENGSLGQAKAWVSTYDFAAGPGAGVQNRDYSPTNRFISWNSVWSSDHELHAALMGNNNNTYTTNRARGYTYVDPTGFNYVPTRFIHSGDSDVFVPIRHNGEITGDLLVGLRLYNATSMLTLGGQPIPIGLALGKSAATMTIIDDDRTPGVLGFVVTNYSTVEGKSAVLAINRTGGISGTLTVDFRTVDDSAVAPKDYVYASRTVTFGPGETNKTFTILTSQNNIAQLDRTFKVFLFNPSGYLDTELPRDTLMDPTRTNAWVTIVDDDFAPGRISFEYPSYSPIIDQGLVNILVKRSGGSLGEIKMWYTNIDGSAKAGIDYTPTSGMLYWPDGDISSRTITLAYTNSLQVMTNKSFSVQLYNPLVNNQPNTNALGNNPLANVTIVNNNTYGTLSFSRTSYMVDERGIKAIVAVLRSQGLAGTVSVNVSTAPITARAGIDYQATNQTLSFAPGEASKPYEIYVAYDPQLTGDKTLQLQLSNPRNGTIQSGSAMLTIVDNELSNIPAGSPDNTFISPGTDGFIYGLALQGDGDILIGGDFTLVNNINMSRLARLNADGTLDRGFDPGTGPNGLVRTLVIQPDSRIVIGGSFTSYNGTNWNYLARLSMDGSADATFNLGSGADNPVYTVALQSDSKILVGGAFASYNSVSSPYIVRLNTNGTVDVTFKVGTSTDGPVYAIAVQADGKILLGGNFTSCNGFQRNRLVRLNANGSVDTEFLNTGTGFDAPIWTITVQPDGKILVGGLFKNVHSQTLGRIARLNSDGTLDGTFNPGSGADEAVYTLALQIDGKIVVGGDFTHLNGLNRSRIGRLNPDGTPDPTINIGLGANGFVWNVAVQPTREILFCGAFTEFDGKPFHHLARIHGGAMAGSGTLEFSSAAYSVLESATNAMLTVRRKGGTTGAVTVDYQTIPGGTAKPDIDYRDTRGTLLFPEGETFATFLVPVMGNNNYVDATSTVFLTLTNYTDLTTGQITNSLIGNQPTATLIIENIDSGISFTATDYSVNKNSPAGGALISIVRVGSTIGSVSVNFATVAGGTAVTNMDYLPVDQTVIFGPGESVKNILVPVVNNDLIQGNRTVALVLRNPSFGGVLVNSIALLTIIDSNNGPGRLSFSKSIYYVEESFSRAVVNVERTNGTAGVVSVGYATRNGSAIGGTDYIATNNFLAFADGETSKSIQVTILNDLVMEDDKAFELYLFSPTGGAVVGSPTNTSVVIINNNFIYGNISLDADAYIVNENGTNLVVQVRRQNGTNGVVSVDFHTKDITAVSSVNYQGVHTTLVFNPGETNKTILIPIFDDLVVTDKKTFEISLSNPQGGVSLGVNKLANATILDSDLLVFFSANSYIVREDEVQAQITVMRTLGGPDWLSVNYAVTNGTGRDGVNFSAVQGKLTFSAGELSKSFTVPILRNYAAEGNVTALLSLSDPSGSAILGKPNTAVLTIYDVDGPIIVGAGSALKAESLSPPNEVIDPGETVTLDFGFRNIGKQNTTNLLVTLLATNGVQDPSGAQNLGVVVAGGLLKSTNFTFTAQGTTGSVVTATFRLQDGAMQLGETTFQFILGSSRLSLANTATLMIPDYAPAEPYPSSIMVSGMNGKVSKVTVTVNRLAHSYPHDINMLLVSPNGRAVILLADSGDGASITNVTLTFDDAAPSQVPRYDQIFTGTYKPTHYQILNSLPPPAPAAPYNYTLSTFTGIDPNGNWSLYVSDDSRLDSGRIVGGWQLNITTAVNLNSTADLGLALTAPTQVGNVSSNFVYSINVVNNGPVTATGVALTNTLPEGLSFVSALVPKGSYLQMGNRVIFNLLVVNIGESMSATVTALATNTGMGTISAIIGANEVDLNPGNDVAILPITINSTVVPIITGGAAYSSGQFQFNISGWPGQPYVVEYSTNLVNWLFLYSNTIPTPTFQFKDSNAVPPNRFYRALPGPSR